MAQKYSYYSTHRAEIAAKRRKDKLKREAARRDAKRNRRLVQVEK